jgi:myosin heavy subunit
MDPQSQEPRRGISPHIIYLGIIALLLAAGVYLFTTKSKTEDELVLKDEQLLTMGNDKEIIETEYNDALRRLDEMKTESQQMDSLLTTKDGEISEMRNKIEKLLKQKKLSASELAEANSLITELKSKMNGYQQQIIALKQENVELTEDNKALTEDKTLLTKEREKLTEEKKGLEKTVELGSVLRASSIRLEAINERKNLLGKEKEKETDKAKRADLIRISFDVDDNRISESGEKMLYICVYDPAGKVIAGSSSNRFKLADNSEMPFTASKSIPYKQGEKVKGISTEWKPLSRFDKGNYKVEIYHMGHKIGSEMVSLR